MVDVTGVVFERDKLYGGFENVSAVSQGMKDAARLTDNFNRLSPNKREAIDMILHKIGRAISGPKDCKDNWTDIQGYAKLIEDTFDKPKLSIRAETEWSPYNSLHMKQKLAENHFEYANGEGGAIRLKKNDNFAQFLDDEDGEF